jgi:hypothetical protein
MKVRFKTAHGYLSFQPDGRVEYRDKAGSWEEFDVEGWLEPVQPAPQPGQPSPGQPPALAGPTPEMSAAYVAAVKAQLEREGVNLVGPCGAFAIVKRVAWGLRGAGIGLLSKPGGNNCDGYSVDYLVRSNGDGVDILSDAGGTNGPQWDVKPGEFAGEDRWRPPVQP